MDYSEATQVSWFVDELLISARMFLTGVASDQRADEATRDAAQDALDSIGLYPIHPQPTPHLVRMLTRVATSLNEARIAGEFTTPFLVELRLGAAIRRIEEARSAINDHLARG